MGRGKTKFINFSNKLTELLADVTCVIFEEGELTRTVLQRIVTVILTEGERLGIKKELEIDTTTYEFHWVQWHLLTILEREGGREILK